MRRLATLLIAAAACAAIGPTSLRRADAQPSWPPLSSDNRWVMVEAEPMTDRPGGAAEVLEICRRAKIAGYTGLMLWDSNLWERQLPPGYLENATMLKDGLHKLGFTLMVQMAPRGYANVRWSGDETMCEPRPADPHPNEKDYRYLCLSHPGVIAGWEEMLRRAEDVYHPIGWLLQYDEIRVAATDQLCKDSRKTPGQLLKEHAQKSIAMFKRVTPGRVIAVWSDMFDPKFNASAKRYYHVNGSLAAAAGAIPSDVLIMSWNDKPDSFGYWSSRGNKQVVPVYFDRDDLTPTAEASLIRAARRYRGSMLGWMFCTWKRNYTEVEAIGTAYGGGGGSRASLEPPARPAPQLAFQLP